MTEKEICLDLSKKIKLSNTLYISLGTLLFSTVIMVIQLLMLLSKNGWVWTDLCFGTLLNFVFSIRGNDNGKKSTTNDV